MEKLTSRQKADAAGQGMSKHTGIISEPRATIEAIIMPEAAPRVVRAFSAGQPVMLDGCGGPWIITRMETSQDFDQAAPVTRVWGTWTEPSDFDWKSE